MRAISSDPIRSLIADMTKPPTPLVPAPLVPKEPPTGYSYQQINCLDSIIRCVCEPEAPCLLASCGGGGRRSLPNSSIDDLTPRRYLESCNIPNTVKRKCGSSTSDEDKPLEAGSNTGTFTAGSIVCLRVCFSRRLVSLVFLGFPFPFFGQSLFTNKNTDSCC